ncbi:MAG TPA: hypothetical protein VIC28_13615 [Thermoanaerobaculia bacterium]|jgi:hypothetical protein
MRSTLRLLAILLLVTACNDSGGPPPAGGGVTGEVHLLGDPPPQAQAGVARLYISVADMDRERPVAEVPLEGGPTDWTFEFETIAAGRYYLNACFVFGCGDYADIEGNPAPLDVRPNETVTANIAF